MHKILCIHAQGFVHLKGVLTEIKASAPIARVLKPARISQQIGCLQTQGGGKYCEDKIKFVFTVADQYSHMPDVGLENKLLLHNHLTEIILSL